MNLEEIESDIHICHSKIEFLCDVFCQTKSFEFSEKSQTGFFYILDDIARVMKGVHTVIAESSGDVNHLPEPRLSAGGRIYAFIKKIFI